MAELPTRFLIRSKLKGSINHLQDIMAGGGGGGGVGLDKEYSVHLGMTYYDVKLWNYWIHGNIDTFDWKKIY